MSVPVDVLAQTVDSRVGTSSTLLARVGRTVVWIQILWLRVRRTKTPSVVGGRCMMANGSV